MKEYGGYRREIELAVVYIQPCMLVFRDWMQSMFDHNYIIARLPATHLSLLATVMLLGTKEW